MSHLTNNFKTSSSTKKNDKFPTNKSHLIYVILAITVLLNTPSTRINCQCPLTSYQTDIYMGSLTVGSQLTTNLQASGTSSQESKCYNVTLDKPFNNQPNIATALSDLNSQYSTNLYLSVKPLVSANSLRNSPNIVSFVVRTPWRYTFWNRIKFNFIVQQRPQIQVGIYQIQTSLLSSCSQSKQIQVFFPYNTNFITSPSVTTYLTSFQISSKTLNSNNDQSPFEIQQRLLSRNISGFTLSISVTSQTLINNLAISFVAFDNRLTIGQILSDNLVYQDYQLKQFLSFVVPVPASSSILNNIRSIFTGLTGFIAPLGRQSNLGNQFVTVFNNNSVNTGNSISFTSNTGVLYLSYSYVGLIGSPCNLCNGYPYVSVDSNCVASCPAGTYLLSNNNCVSCSPGMVWNGTSCIYSCTGGRVWNSFVNACQCPLANSNWNGNVCVTCLNNQVWNSLSLTCACGFGSNWNGSFCVTCQSGRVWNSQSLTCQCPLNTNWNGIQCVSCNGGSLWNSTFNVCACPTGSSWSGNLCVSMCRSNQIWNPQTNVCQCPSPTYWNGTNCVSCLGNQVWNFTANNCQCPLGTNFVNNACRTVQSCSGGRIFNINTNVCECATDTFWDSFTLNCIACPSGSYFNITLYQCVCTQTNKLYDQINKRCVCSNGYQLNNNNQCVLITPSCPSGQVFNGTQCVTMCQVGSYFNGISCVTFEPQCPTGTKWQVYQCVVINTNVCPTGMIWSTNRCISSEESNCTQLQDYYWDGTMCILLSSRCPYPLEWRNTSCLPVTKSCPSGSYYNGYLCVSYTSCSQNMIWSASLVKCVCAQGTFWNGKKCLRCDYGMIYLSNSEGCVCPSGTFFNGSTCAALNNQNFCRTVNYANWNGTHCVCYPGYIALNNKCQCYGLQLSGWCNRCYQKQNSFYKNGICVCSDGYIESNGQCIKPQISNNGSNSPIQTSSICNIGTFWDSQQKRCLQCSDGCISCIDCYKCLQCQVGFIYNSQTQLCQQICGDGKRFRLQCDDGNNANGDGCSMDCMIQNTYTCLGGSPNSKDSCSRIVPNEITLIQTGQSHLYGKIILNVRANYLPTNLTTSIGSMCGSNSCSQILSAQIIQGDKSSTSIKTQYLGGAFNSFSLTIDFNREPIQQFTLQIQINQDLKMKYFPNVDITKKLTTIVSPAYLSLIVEKDILE